MITSLVTEWCRRAGNTKTLRSCCGATSSNSWQTLFQTEEKN